jgi:hypothetical protein
MAETQRVSSSLLSPPLRLRSARRSRLPHPPPRYNAPQRLPEHDTESLEPPVQLAVPPEPQRHEPVQAFAREERQVSPRTRAERLLMTALLLGLGLTALILLTNPALSRSDLLLGVTVLVAGMALLALMELCRRTCPPRR